MDEIGKLRKSKKMAAGVDKKGEQAGLSEKRVDELRAEIKESDNELNAIKEEQVSSRPHLHVIDVPAHSPAAWGFLHKLFLGILSAQLMQLTKRKGAAYNRWRLSARQCQAESDVVPAMPAAAHQWLACKRWHPSRCDCACKGSK